MNITLNTVKNEIIANGSKSFGASKAELVKNTKDANLKRAIKTHCPEDGVFFFALKSTEDVIIVANEFYSEAVVISKGATDKNFAKTVTGLKSGNKASTVTLNTKKSVPVQVVESASDAKDLKIAALEAKLEAVLNQNAKQSEIIRDVAQATTIEEAHKIVARKHMATKATSKVSYTLADIKSVDATKKMAKALSEATEELNKALNVVSEFTTAEEQADLDNKAICALELITISQEMEIAEQSDIASSNINKVIDDVMAQMNSTSAAVNTFDRLFAEFKAREAAEKPNKMTKSQMIKLVSKSKIKAL